MKTLRLTIVPGRFAVCRFGPQEPIPPGVAGASLVSITRTADELSIVCAEAVAPEGGRTESFLKEAQLGEALAALKEAGHEFGD